MRKLFKFSLALVFLILSFCFATEEEEPVVFVVYMKDGKNTLEGILKMHFSKKLSGFTEYGYIEISFNNIKSIVPTQDAKKVVVHMKTGDVAKVSMTNSLYLKNEVYGVVDLKLDKIKKIELKE